jgi:hypothetical protein
MSCKISLRLKFLLIFIISGCGETKYLLTSDAPPILEGFYGFRWTTPMSIVDEEFPKRTGATLIDSLNRYNTSNFSEAYFLGEESSLCWFGFNESGLISVNILLNTDYQSFEKKLYSLKEKLSTVYGEPLEFIGNPYDRESPEYISQHQWVNGRLNLTLLLDYKVEINAYSFVPNLGIHN